MEGSLGGSGLSFLFFPTKHLSFQQEGMRAARLAVQAFIIVGLANYLNSYCKD